MKMECNFKVEKQLFIKCRLKGNTERFSENTEIQCDGEKNCIFHKMSKR